MLLFDTPTWLTGFNVMLSLLGLVVGVGGAIIYLLARRRDETVLVQTKRAEANESLVKVRDSELSDLKKKCDKCTEELEDVTVELRSQMAINVDQLFEYWSIRDSEMARMQNLERDNRILRIRLGDIKE